MEVSGVATQQCAALEVPMILPTTSEAEKVLDAGADSGGAWSVRRTVAFVVVVCGAFWLAVGMLVAYLIKAL